MNDGWEPTPNPVARIIAARTAQVALPVMAALTGVAAFDPPRAWTAVLWAGGATIAALSAYFAATFYARTTFGFPLITRLPADAGNVIALTIDDGPHPETTPRLLDVLAAYGATATFFTVAQRARAYPELVRRIASDGHTIGVHGLRHREMVLQSAAQIERDLTDAETIFADILGSPLPVRLFRPPHGFKTYTLCRTVTRLGWTIVSWSLDSRDYDSPDAPTLIARLLSARPGDILLLHERPGAIETTATALTAVLPGWAGSMTGLLLPKGRNRRKKI